MGKAQFAVLVIGDKGRAIAVCVEGGLVAGAVGDQSIHDRRLERDHTPTAVLSAVQQCACGRGYLRAADVTSFWTLADGVVGQMIRCTETGRFSCIWKAAW